LLELPPFVLDAPPPPPPPVEVEEVLLAGEAELWETVDEAVCPPDTGDVASRVVVGGDTQDTEEAVVDVLDGGGLLLGPVDKS